MHAYGQFCPVAQACSVLGERWTVLIVRELLCGSTRFSELQRGISRISPTMLAARLKELEAAGLVVRRGRGGRAATYHLTPIGRELEPIVFAIGAWGLRWTKGRIADEELDVELLMTDIGRRIDAAGLPDGRTVLRFRFTDVAEFSEWWLLIEGGAVDVCIDDPGEESDLSFVTTVRVLAEVWMGRRPLADALSTRDLRVSGEGVLKRSLSRWFVLHPYARAGAVGRDAGGDGGAAGVSVGSAD